ncbi:MAG: proline dehydrogenase family protein [Jatrophihabitans sp.]
MLRTPILLASRNKTVERVVTRAPLSRGVVARFVGGAGAVDAVGVATKLEDAGLTVSLDHLGEDTTDRTAAHATVDAYLDLLTRLSDAGLTGFREGRPLTARAEVSVKLSAVGQALPGDGAAISLDNARQICGAAKNAGATVTLDMEDHTTTDATLATLAELRADFPNTGAVLQAYLRRTEGDCRDLATAGSRVRLCKGAYAEPESVAYQGRDEVDRSYVRCVNILMRGDGYPMLATHDPRLVAIGVDRAAFFGKDAGDFEFQMLYGIRPDEQKRLAASGHAVRVYVPYGAQWYGYLMRRLAERPANLAFFARALISKR